MITITSTSELTEVAWIIMGVWAGVNIFQEVKDFATNWFEDNNYWKNRHSDMVDHCDDLRKQIDALKGE